MEWLINRRRMMFNRVIPPDYLTFEDAEFWRIACEIYGDYYQTVITDNGDNTVNIVKTFESWLYHTKKKSIIIENRENVDNSGGTYIAGTTKEAVGITQNQCDAVIVFTDLTDSRNTAFCNNEVITSLNDFAKFRNCTRIYSNYSRIATHTGFSNCTNATSVIFPESLTNTGTGFVNVPLTVILPNFDNITVVGNRCFWECPYPSYYLPNIVTIEEYGFGNNNNNIQYIDLGENIASIGKRLGNYNCVVVCRALNPPSLGGGFRTKSIYVPAAAVEDYKSATNWSAQASMIQAIEGTWYETHHSLEPTT